MKSIDQSINRSINQSINPSINQSINQSNNQSINQPIRAKLVSEAIYHNSPNMAFMVLGTGGGGPTFSAFSYLVDSIGSEGICTGSFGEGHGQPDHVKK
jgi:hypothetical protein